MNSPARSEPLDNKRSPHGAHREELDWEPQRTPLPKVDRKMRSGREGNRKAPGALGEEK
jgi:hypothetical protein